MIDLSTRERKKSRTQNNPSATYSLNPGDAHTHHCSVLVQVMVCRLFGAKPSFDYRQMHLQISVRLESESPTYYRCLPRKCSENVLCKILAILFRSHTDVQCSVCDHFIHYIDVVMTTTASQITSFKVLYSTVYSDADQRNHQSSASLAFVWGIHRDRWIPRTKGQLRGKCFHLMTSSCSNSSHHVWDVTDDISLVE